MRALGNRVFGALWYVIIEEGKMKCLLWAVIMVTVVMPFVGVPFIVFFPSCILAIGAGLVLNVKYGVDFRP